MVAGSMSFPLPPVVRALIRSGSDPLEPALRAMRAAPAAAWREAVGEAIRARQPQALTDVLDAAPVDWATAQLSSQNLAFHGIFDALLPFKMVT